MRTAGIKTGDIIKCDVRGSRFYAKVKRRGEGGEFEIAPLDRHVTYYTVSSRQIIEHYRKVRSQVTAVKAP